MSTFEERVRSFGGHGLPCFDDLDPDDQAELAGTYILEKYKAHEDVEPIVEALIHTGAENEFSPHAKKLYELMAEGIWSKEKAAQWTEGLIDLICKEMAGSVQTEMEKANEPPFWDEDEAAQRMRVVR